MLTLFKEYIQNTIPNNPVRAFDVLEDKIPRFILWKGQLVPGEVVYAICCKTSKQIKYIGVTNSLKRRLAEHRLGGKYRPGEECVFYSFAPRTIERFLIELVKPKRNIIYNTG